MGPLPRRFSLILERAGLGAALQRIGSEFRHLYVILVVTVGWVFFRADDLSQAAGHLRAMAGFGSGDGIAHHVWLHLQPDVALALIIGAVGSTPYLANLGQRIVAYAGSLRRGGREMLDATGGSAFSAALYAILLLSVLSIAGGNYNPFIYFRF